MTADAVILQRHDDGLTWISEVSRKFSDATGWPMQFRPDDGQTVTRGGASENGSPNSCWVSQIRDSQGPIGRLQIDLPQEPGQDRLFLMVCELSELISSLVSRVVAVAEALERRNRDVTFLLEADSAPRQHKTVHGILGEFLRLTAELAGYWGAAFFLLASNGRELKLRATYRIERSDVPVPFRLLDTVPPDLMAFQSGSNTISANGESVYRRWLPIGCETGLCMPVNTDVGPAGSLWLYDRRQRTLDGGEQQVIRAMADHIATVLERVVLLRESELHHRQNNDLQVASQCQQETTFSVETDHAAIETAAICASRFELGGDLCEVIPLDGDRVFFAVGDASGDSVPAAMVMSAVRGAIRAMLVDCGHKPLSPASLLQSANETLHGLSATFQFMSLVVGVFDFPAETLTYSNAGHPPPIVIRDGDARELSTHGILLGIISNSEYQSATVSVKPGDVLVAYSDGISEAMDERDSIFGAEGILRALRDAPADSARSVLETIRSQVDRFVSPTNKGDDRTLLVLRLR